MIGAEVVPAVEVHSALGRNDLEVNAGDRHWCFEIKFARKSEEIEKLLAEGIEQVKQNRYGESAHGKTLMRAVLVFDEAERRITVWRSVNG